MSQYKLMKKEKINPIIAGVIFLIFGISAILDALFILKNPLMILWLCYISLILLGIGFLTKNKTLVKSQLNLLTVPLLLWTIDFIYFLIAKNSFLGITNYFFQQGHLSSKIITSQHLFTIPLSFYSIRFLPKRTKKPLIISLITIIIVFLASRIEGSIENNLNLVFHFQQMNIPYYPLFWFLVVSTTIFLTNFLIRKLKV